MKWKFEARLKVDLSNKILDQGQVRAQIGQGEGLKAEFQFSVLPNSKIWHGMKKIHVLERSEGENFRKN